MYGTEYVKDKLGIDFRMSVEDIKQKLIMAQPVYICCIGAAFTSITDGRTIPPTKVMPILNSRMLKKSWRSYHMCPVILVQYKKDGTLYSSGITAYGSTCHSDGDAVAIFDTYEECVAFWNNRIDEVLAIKNKSLKEINNQISTLISSKL